MPEHVVQCDDEGLVTIVVFGHPVHQLPPGTVVQYSKENGYHPNPGDTPEFAALITALLEDPACQVELIWTRRDGGLLVFHTRPVTKELTAAVRIHVDAM